MIKNTPAPAHRRGLRSPRPQLPGRASTLRRAVRTCQFHPAPLADLVRLVVVDHAYAPRGTRSARPPGRDSEKASLIGATDREDVDVPALLALVEHVDLPLQFGEERLDVVDPGEGRRRRQDRSPAPTERGSPRST